MLGISDGNCGCVSAVKESIDRCVSRYALYAAVRTDRFAWDPQVPDLDGRSTVLLDAPDVMAKTGARVIESEDCQEPKAATG